MGIKHLFGFFLILIGFGATFLILMFMINNQFYTDLFLYSLGIFALLSLIGGIFLLNRHS